MSSSLNAANSAAAVARTALDEFGVKGEFKRSDAAWRNWVQAGMIHTYVIVIVVIGIL
jgi:hypothetical protein